MRTALIRLPSKYADWYRSPALGLSYISAYLEDKGFDCKVFDSYFHSWSDEELLCHLKDYKPEVVGITAMTHEIIRVAQIASQLKKQLNIPVIIGGCHVTALLEKTLEEFPVFDYGVYGEGEKTTLELLRYLQQGMPELGDIKGLIFRNGRGSICVNESRSVLISEELDALPYPGFHHCYGDNPSALASKDSYYVMFTSRGCPYNCAFCMRVLGRKLRRRSAQSILQEMKYAIARYGAHTFDFADEIFLLNDSRTRNILQLMVESGLSKKIRWSALTRVNFVKPDLIDLAKKAGCYRLEMGVESGDNEILKNIGKNITVEQVKMAVKIIKDVGVSLGTYFILGHPNETSETLRKTVDLAVKLNTDTVAVGIMVPYPGTKIYDMALAGEGGYRLLTKDWAEYDKYGGRALEIKNLPYKELVKWQKRTIIYFYLENVRLIDAFKYFWKRRKALLFFTKNCLFVRLLSKKQKPNILQ